MPSIIQKPIGRCGFTNQMYPPVWFVVHFTGGTPNLQSLYNYWVSQCNIGSNSHFGIERNDNQWARAGDIWQFLPLTDGACANCCAVAGACAPFLNTGTNYNPRTISVEAINANSGNEGLCTGPQYDSLVWLIRDTCKKMGISTTKYVEYTNSKGASFTFGDGQGGVIMHRDFDQINRARCPGMQVYLDQMKQIMKDVNGGSSGGDSERKKYMQQWGDARPEMEKRMWEQVIVMRNSRLPAEEQINVPRTGTGLYNQFVGLLDQGIYIGGVTSEEFDFKGQTVQNFSAGQIALNRATGKYSIIRAG